MVSANGNLDRPFRPAVSPRPLPPPPPREEAPREVGVARGRGDLGAVEAALLGRAGADQGVEPLVRRRRGPQDGPGQPGVASRQGQVEAVRGGGRKGEEEDVRPAPEEGARAANVPVDARVKKGLFKLGKLL